MPNRESGITTCPHCHRTVRTDGGRYMLHNVGTYEQVCPLSGQHQPIEGDSPTAYVSRAHLVADLACQVQDADPAIVWAYLGALDFDELRRMTMLALATTPVDQTVREMFAWVSNLPQARLAVNDAS